LLNPGKPALEDFRAHGKDFDLHAAELSLAGELFLDRIAFTQGHGHELANHTLFYAVTVQPRLFGRDHVILRVTAETAPPGLPGNGADLASGHFEGEGICRFAILYFTASEIEPERLGLPHGQEHAAALEPIRGHVPREIVNMPQGKGSQARRERIILPVIGNAKRSLEINGELRTFG
jgi:hypothetical protein